MMTKQTQTLSCKLYDLLETVGVTERNRQLARSMRVTKEIIETILFQASQPTYKHVGVYYCGSSFEGSLTPNTVSDIDIILNIEHFKVAVRQDHINETSRSLVVQDVHTCPGYIKLQLITESQPQTVFNSTRLKRSTQLEIDCMGRICRTLNTVSTFRMHGPAIAINHSIHGHFLDAVVSIYISDISGFAKEWIRRNRAHDWPTSDQVKEMVDMGCFAVNVGHERSVEKLMEWRLSFSKQERILMSSLSPVQHKVYVLLKLIRKDLIQQRLDEEEVLTSYHCKTCILHAVENTSRKIWRSDNIVNCVLLCLKMISFCVKSRFFPNFFNKDQNLLAKIKHRRNRRTLVDILQGLLDLGEGVFFCLKTEHIGDMLTNAGYKKYVNFVKITEKKLVVFLSTSILDINEALKEVVNAGKSTLSNLLPIGHNTETVNDHTLEETQTAISFMKSWIHFFLARACLCEYLAEPTKPEVQNYIDRANQHFSRATQTGPVSVQISLAAFLYSLRKYEECSLLLNSIYAELNTAYFICMCTVNSVCCIPDSLCALHCLSPIEILSSVTPCITFLQSEKELAAPALRLEMERSEGTLPGLRSEFFDKWFDSAVVEPLSYIYFMQYSEKEYALTLLNVRSNSEIFHRDTSYNLLGWAYIQENRIGDAIWCFIQSWNIRPHHNAAKHHMRGLSDILFTLVCHWNQGCHKLT